MAKELSGISLNGTKYVFRDVLLEDFPSIGTVLPISGGWGYSIEDAIKFDKTHDDYNADLPFNYVNWEYVLVGKRLYEELIIFRPKGQQFSNLNWELEKQGLLGDNGKSYDHLVFNVTCFPDNNGDFAKVFSAEEMLTFKTEYYFDITDFFA